MLTKFFIQNFQSLAYPQSFRLAPLTLIVGANSSGKSAIGRSLRLIQQSLEEGELHFAGERVDLTGFFAAVSDRKVKNLMKIGLGVDGAGVLTSPNFRFRTENIGLDIEISQSRDSLKTTYEIVLDFEVEKKASEPENPQEDFEDYLRAGTRVIDVDVIGGGSMRLRIAEDPIFDMPLLEVGVEGDLKALSEFVFDREQPRWPGQTGRGVRTEANHFLPENIGGIIELDDLAAHDPSKWSYVPIEFRGMRPRVQGHRRHYEQNSAAFQVVDFLANLIDRVFSLWENTATQIRWVGPLRSITSGFQTKRTQKALVDSSGSNVQSVLLEMNDENFKRVSSLLNQVTAGKYSIARTTMKSDSPLFGTLEQVVLVDRSSGQDLPVSFQDAGVGLSQVLPILVQMTVNPMRAASITRSRRPVRIPTTFIEQPELHLHPVMQAELADVFIGQVRPKARNREQVPVPRSQIIIETHSEAMIMRIQRRIREGVISADDVCVIAVEEFAAGGSLAQEYRVASDGSFIDELPKSFSQLRLNDLLGKD